MNNKRIILCGSGGSGKNFFRDYLQKQGHSIDVSYTTRPMREGEKEGVDYYFKTNEEFINLKNMGFFYEDVEFNGWRYGTSRINWEKKKVCIKTPSGIKQLSKKDLEESYIVFFDIDEAVRRERLSKRSDADTIERRIESDRKDFKDFSTFDLQIELADFNPELVLKTINESI